MFTLFPFGFRLPGDEIEDDEEADDAFDRAHPPPQFSPEDADLVAEAERALGAKVEQAQKEGALPEGQSSSLKEASEGGEQLFNVEGGALGGKGETAREPTNLKTE